MTPLRCALLSVAHGHATSYAAALQALPETTLAVVWDEEPARGTAFAARYEIPFVPDLATILERDDLDAVVIAAANARHRMLCEAACRAGKHVLCEKPLATTAEDAEVMIAAADSAGVVLATAFPMRHNLPARRIKEQLRASTIGQVLAIRATNHGQRPPGWFLDPAQAGGGAVMDHTAHVADLLRWYLEDEPIEVYAAISNGIHGGAVDDVAFLTIGFRSGVIATLDPSWSRPASFPIWGDVTMQIAGTMGTLDLDAFAQTLALYPQSAERTAWLGWGANADTALIADFAHAIRDNRPPAASGRDGERALAVILAAYASAVSGQPVAIQAPTAERRDVLR